MSPPPLLLLFLLLCAIAEVFIVSHHARADVNHGSRATVHYYYMSCVYVRVYICILCIDGWVCVCVLRVDPFALRKPTALVELNGSFYSRLKVRCGDVQNVVSINSGVKIILKV